MFKRLTRGKSGKVRRAAAFMAALLLALALYPCVPAKTQAAVDLSGSCGSGVEWELKNGTLTISGSGDMTDYTEDGFSPWYDSRESITTIKIESGVTSIGDLAFYQCENLTSVYFASTVEEIGSIAFAQCTSLKNVTLCDGLIKIGASAFEGCTGLVSIRLPDTLEYIGDRAFYNCSSLAGVVIPASVTYLGDSVFAKCTSLSYAQINADISTIPYFSFYGCTLLHTLYISESVTSVQSGAFDGCPYLTDVTYDGTEESVTEAITASYESSTETYSNTDINTDYTQTDSAVITIEYVVYNYVDDDGNAIENETNITAQISDEDGWDDLASAVESAADTSNLTIDVYTNETSVSANTLSALEGTSATLLIHTGDNITWEIELDDQDSDSLSDAQNFSVTVTYNETVSSSIAEVIGDAESFTITFKKTTLNSTVYVPLGTEYAQATATLYKISGGKLVKIETVIVGDDGTAAFSLSGTANGKYIVALNVDGEDVDVISESDLEEYESDSVYTLQDENGNYYEVTGTTSTFPITLAQLMMIVAGFVVIAVIVIAVVLKLGNKKRKKKINIDDYLTEEEKKEMGRK